jgi:hypothetical protein
VKGVDAHIIEIDSIVLSGSSEHASIEAAVLRALREAGVGDALGGPAILTTVTREVTRSVETAIKKGKV